MKRPKKGGKGRIGMWVEGISYHNPYPEFETELIKTYSKKCFKSSRGFWRVRENSLILDLTTEEKDLF